MLKNPRRSAEFKVPNPATIALLRPKPRKTRALFSSAESYVGCIVPTILHIKTKILAFNGNKRALSQSVCSLIHSCSNY